MARKKLANKQVRNAGDITQSINAKYPRAIAYTRGNTVICNGIWSGGQKLDIPQPPKDVRVVNYKFCPLYFGKGDAVVSVTGVTISPKTLELAIGETGSVTSEVSPENAADKSVTYSSSDETIATVDNTGKITGVAEGSAIITVTTTDGGKTDTSTITVKEPVINVTGVTISPTTVSVKVGATTQLSTTVSPDNATNKSVTYLSSNTGKATVDSTGKVTGVARGSATITVTTVDGGKTGTSTITIEENRGE